MINIEVTGMAEAIKKFADLTNTFEQKVKLVVERLMARGYNVASAGFKNAAYPGTNDVVVLNPVWEGDSIVLMAEGDAVAFIEFGTGVKFENYPTDIPGSGKDPYTELGLSPRGTYGKGQGKNEKGWVYVGDEGQGGLGYPFLSKGRYKILTYGNPPARAMYNAAVTVADKSLALEIAREVFSR